VADVAALRAAVASNRWWYHSIDLAPGVLTPGHVDLRGLPDAVLPATLVGRRALDVGTYDGFWAFALEQRGAAEVVAIDVPSLDAAEWPPVNRERLVATARAGDLALGRGFAIAADALGSRVRRVEVGVYDLDADAIGGPVDFAFLGAMLLHVRDPVRALERIRSVLSPGGRLTILEPIDVRLTLLAPRRPAARFQATETDFNWWVSNVACLRAWLRAAGFRHIARGGLHRASGLTQCALAGWD
jgi:SAM-dependent methyltransferase